MISRLQLCFPHACRVDGPGELAFEPGLNVLVGPNGSGKSTVLRALHDCDECRKVSDGTPATQYFSSETMNPHTAGGAPGDWRNMVLRTRGLFSSHGQIMKAALASFPLRQGETLLVDEPEAGQDLEGVERMRRGFAAICSGGGQVIAASHHPLFLRDGNIIELLDGYAEKVRTGYCRALCERVDAP